MAGQKIKYRFAYLALSLALSSLICAPLLLMWFLFTSIILGYGDSGPDWDRTVTYLIPIITITVGTIGGQVLFQYGLNKDRKKSPSAENNQSYILKYLFHLLATLVGLSLGLFLGLYVVPKIFHAIVDMLDFGNSDASMLFVVFIIVTIIIITICIFYSNKWTRNYLDKKRC